MVLTTTVEGRERFPVTVSEQFSDRLAMVKKAVVLGRHCDLQDE